MLSAGRSTYTNPFVMGALSLCLAGLFVIGCGAASNNQQNGSGGASPTGGNTGAGGKSASGGNSGTGGNTSAGGTSGKGGSGGSAGTSSSGGSGSGGTSSGGKGGTSSTGGSVGSGGTSSTGGSVGNGGTSSVSSAGSGGTTGGGGNTATANCTITPAVTISSKIGTVGIVTFTTDLSSPTSAHIDFGLTTSYGLQAPVDLTAPSYQTLLLGMKQSKTYHYRVVVSNASGQCAGGDNTLTTKTLANGLPTVTISAASGTISGGYLSSCFFQGMGGGSATGAFILDADGEYVWVYGSGEMGRAEMSYDGKYMYYAAVNAMEASSSSMHRVTMDGLTVDDYSSVVSGMHHDFTTALPDGTIGFIRRVGSVDWVSELKDGTVTNKFNVTAMFGSSSGVDPHANAIHYHVDDDSYTISDRDYNAYVKVSRSGTKAWQIGGTSSSFTGDVTWSVNHGHQWIGPNRLFFFNNGNGSGMGGPGGGGIGSTASHAIELSLDLTTMKATNVWDYSASGVSSSVLGDVQILDNGNRFITYSTAGEFHEVDGTTKALIQSISFSSGGATGYAVKRASLYGPPPTR